MNANLSRAQQAFKELVTLRRDFHAHPELSWKERRTQQKSSNIWINGDSCRRFNRNRGDCHARRRKEQGCRPWHQG